MTTWISRSEGFGQGSEVAKAFGGRAPYSGHRRRCLHTNLGLCTRNPCHQSQRRPLELAAALGWLRKAFQKFPDFVGAQVMRACCDGRPFDATLRRRCGALPVAILRCGRGCSAPSLRTVRPWMMRSSRAATFVRLSRSEFRPLVNDFYVCSGALWVYLHDGVFDSARQSVVGASKH